MKRKLVLLAVLGIATAGTASAQWAGIVETRQAGMALQSADFAGIRAVVAAKGDVKTLENPAKAIARWIKQFPTLFPAGTEQGHDTKALPAIWSDKAGFQKAADDLAEASTKMAELAKAGDTDAVTAQVKVMGDACAACHRTYRAR
jgi:cytochrome c556